MPVLGAGGVGRGRQMAAALVLGCEGVWAGSLWLKTVQSEVIPEIKQKMFESEAMKPFVTHRMSPGPDIDVASDEAVLEYIRAEAGTAYHPTSTCAIGKVVDARLNVLGLEGLTIADASVMPNVVSGNTNAAAIMIGEKAADLLLEEKETKVQGGETA